jgi:hypothetical protein
LFGLAAAGDDAFDSTTHGILHGAEFGDHAAGAKGGLFLLSVMNHDVHILHDWDGAFLRFLYVTQQAWGAGQ